MDETRPNLIRDFSTKEHILHKGAAILDLVGYSIFAYLKMFSFALHVKYIILCYNSDLAKLDFVIHLGYLIRTSQQVIVPE